MLEIASSTFSCAAAAALSMTKDGISKVIIIVIGRYRAAHSDGHGAVMVSAGMIVSPKK